MIYGGAVWKQIQLVLLKNPSLTAGEGAQIVRDIKRGIKAMQC